ncbi:putative O-methyltransferase [Polyplosphaeria fusca]|uniref:O-methyltransferase n=1 Tax=Polyplosphaeria fusca TaxID=682080 RepID=A0A9P4QPS9_9PLEO|nr:putative O-methyltransferase [Polyplosphaeria fusca]
MRDEDISILALARCISSLSSQICSYLTSNSFSEPKFTPNTGSVPETPEYEALRAPLNDAALDLLRLVNGPKNTLQKLFFTQFDLAAFQIALDRRFFDYVPLSSGTFGNGAGKASVVEIAQKAGMDVDRTGRVLKMLATHRIFAEVEGECESFTHTASSALLAQDTDLYAAAHWQMDDMLRAASEASTAIDESPFTSNTLTSAFSRRFGTTMYEYYERQPVKAKRVAQALSGWSQFNRNVDELHNGFPWASLKTGKVIDIGGGNGHIAIALARSFPLLQFVVQDISPRMLSQAEQFEDQRVTFQEHDFFTPQPVHDASVFIIRQCLHNQSDEDAIKIVRQVIPALGRCGHGTPLLINEVILPDSGTITRFQEHYLRQVDLCMMVTLGTRQRSEREFRRLINEADERLEVVHVRNNPMGLGLLEVHLNVE